MEFCLKKFILNTKNPHLKLSTGKIEQIVSVLIQSYMRENNLKKISVLDIGGGKGFGKFFYEKEYINYNALDLKESKRQGKINFIKGDITENLEIKEEFDIVFSKDTFEHILNPWDATKNIQKLLKNKGLVMFFVPFSWRYHASPYDTYRYSHTGIQYIIERLGKIKKIESGYIKFGDIKGFWKIKKISL